MSIDTQHGARPKVSVPSRALQALPACAFVLDAVTIAASLVSGALLRTAYALPHPVSDISDSVVIAAPVMFACWLVCLVLSGSYARSVFEAGTDEFRRVASATLFSGGLVGVGCYLFNFSLSRGFFFMTFLIGLPGLLVARLVLRELVHQARRRGSLLHNVIIAGTPGSVDEVAAVLRREPSLGYHVLGAVVPPAMAGVGVETPSRIPVIGTTDQVTRVVRESGVDVLFLAEGSLTSNSQMRSIAWALESDDVQVVVAPSISEVSGNRVRVRPVGGLPLIHVDAPRALEASRWGKRLFDIVGSSLLLLVALPVLAFTAARVKMHDGGPVLFRQVRTGREGKPFSCLKFRTMVVDAESLLARLHAESGFEGGLFKMRDDPRVTAPGRWMRRLSIDELPQLLNVLRGDMSLVGPRPPLPAEVEQYQGHAVRRLNVRPGMTGLWQVSGRSDLSYDEAIRLDLFYVDNWSMFQDVSILLKTAYAVLGSRGAY